MAISFHAEIVRASQEKWGWYVAWKNATGECYLALQRKPKFTLEDFIFRWNKVYIECCDQGWSWYGHILSFELQRDRIRVQLDAKAAREMENDGRIEATFDLDVEGFAELQNALRQVFAGFKYYKDAT